MPLITAYHRPDDLDTALELLGDPRRIPLAGGTVVNADRAPSELEAVDLQDLALDGISTDGATLRLGATVTLDRTAGDDRVPDWLRRACRRELPSTLRTLATIGGTVAVAEPDSVLLAVLLVADTRVELARGGVLDLDELLDAGTPRDDLITAIDLDTTGQVATAATGRTPADVPIVAAVARRAPDGVRLALTGVATRPVLVDPARPDAGLSPPSDFRGSADYRRHLARTLSARAVEAVR